MNPARALFAGVAVVGALALQISLFPHIAIHGVVPQLVLLVVVAASLTCSPRSALFLAFAAGLLLDLVPPADHYAGRWALALVLMAWFVSTARRGLRPGFSQMMLTVGSASFVGVSIFALSGILLRDPVIGVTEMLSVIAIGVGYDLLLAPLVVPAAMAAFRRLGPETERERP